MLKFRLLSEWALLFAASALLIFLAFQQQWTHRLDATLLDFATQQRLTEPSDDIVLVEIDDRSLAQVGNWPWDRARHADLIRRLATYEPERVVVDVLFIEPTDASADDALAQAIGAAGNVVLPHSFVTKPGSVSGTAPVYPLPRLRDAAEAIGHVAVFPDRDGVVRRFTPSLEFDGTEYRHLAVVTASLAANGGVVDAEDASAPITPMHPAGSFASVSAADVLAQSVPLDFLAGKTVFVGATAQGLGDRYAVADHAGRIMTGVEIQANFLDAIDQDRLVHPIPSWVAAAVFLAALGLLFLAFWQLTPRWALYASLSLIAALLLASFMLVASAGLWLPVTAGILGIVVAYPLWGWRRLASVSRFLEGEAQSLDSVISGRDRPPASGFDTIAQQVSRMRGLIGATSERLTFLRQVLATSPDPMLVFDENGGVALMNERAQDVFGVEVGDEALTFQELILTQHATYDAQKRELVLNDGRVFLVARSSLELEGQSEVIALRDITWLRASEQQRREMLEFLSHDMRSPQVAIIGLAGKMGNTMEQGDRLSRIEVQARRTLKLTDDFVQIARLDYEGIVREDTDIGALLHEACDRAYPLAKRKQITLDARLPADPEFCLVDPSALSRAIDNLIDNAIKFSPDRTFVLIALERLDDLSIEITVSDQGPGLPAERLRDTFARFGAHDMRAGPSAGLGLAFVKKVIDEHEGTIEAVSQRGQGTRFVITLPCAVNNDTA